MPAGQLHKTGKPTPHIVALVWAFGRVWMFIAGKNDETETGGGALVQLEVQFLPVMPTDACWNSVHKPSDLYK